MTKYFENTDDLNINKIQLDELIVALGSSLFAGSILQEIDTVLLQRLEELLEAEIILRESGMIMPTDETVH
tara:strand:- start:351 stop:563 length:213 start_codon:yes stop_codon:yes gene_type:complete